MLSKLQNMKQSLRDVTLAIGDKTKAAAAQAKAKITELQTLPEQLPESWEEHIDENGKPYYVDTETGEWYRVKSKQHKRIDTNEKLHIITAESKKEFEEQKNQMDTSDDDNSSQSDSELHTEESRSPKSSQTKSKQEIHHNGPSKAAADTATATITPIKKQKSNHAKRSSTSVSKGWQCEKCTLENVGHAMQCNACLAPRPDTLDDDDEEDLMAINGGLQEMDEQDMDMDASDNSDHDVVAAGGGGDAGVGGQGQGHQQMSTIEAINSAVDASLSAVDGIDVAALSSEHRSKLITFMDFVEAEPKPSLRYLQEANWDIQVAMDTYLRQHPDHPKSRGGSLQFDLQQIQELYNPINFEQDIELPADIVKHGVGRRDSTELEEVPNNNGVRDSDDDEDQGQGHGHDDEHDDDSDSSKSKEEISYEPHSNNNGVRNEYPINGGGVHPNNNYNYDQYGHRRMNTDQQIQIAEQLSVAQSDYDQQLDAYRKEIEALKAEIKESEEENEILKLENNSLEVEKDRYAMQAREIQNDWDRMSGYMTQILSEVSFIEEQRKKGQEIPTPTPKLHNIFEAIQNTIGRNNVNSDDDSEHKLENGKVSDIYSNIADLFTEQAPVLTVHKVENKPERKRKLSFGAVNELFTDTSPIGVPSGSGVSLQRKPNNFLSIEEDENAKRLSYGGVGLLFDNAQQQQANDDKRAFTPNSDGDNPLNVSFKPTYEGIASLFDENNDILGTKSHTFKQPSFAGDIVELFTNPNNEYQQLQEDEVEEDVDVDDEESTDSMDKQRVYTYSDDEEEDEEEYKSASDKEKEIIQMKKNEEKDRKSEEQQRQSMHSRFESYGSNLSDPTPMSRRTSTKRKHSRGPSFAFKDLFRGDDSDSEDRAPSVQSAPEEHDYYAITAYYGIEEDDDAATGWDSRRSSMFGDYGRVHSRRQSKRVQSQMVGDNIKEMFKVDLTKKLTQHLSTGATDVDNVADLFSDEKKAKSKYENPHPTITEEENEDNMTNNAHVVADLFDDNKNIEHKKRDTYTGVKQLFGGDDDSNEDDDIDDDEFVNLRLNANNQPFVPRPSTNVALGATFDSISLIKNRVPKKSESNSLSAEQKQEEAEKAKAKQIELESREKKEKLKEKEINENRMEEMRQELRAEEKAKLTVIQQELEDNFANKLEIIRAEIESNTQIRIRSELTQSLTQSLSVELRENLSREMRPEIRTECREEMEKEMNDTLQRELDLKLNERFESELEDKLNDKMTEWQQSFDAKMDNLRNAMDEREEKHQSEMRIMERSKCDLIQRTAKEIDSLRQIIKNQFSQRQNQQTNMNGMLAGLLNKWM